jgi:hypothetical protein
MWHVKHRAPTEPSLWLIDLSINIGSLRDSMQFAGNTRWPHYHIPPVGPSAAHFVRHKTKTANVFSSVGPLYYIAVGKN